MKISKGISTPHLRKSVNIAIEKLAPLFGLSQEELALARHFTIRRTLRHLAKMYQDHGETVPAYSCLDMFFFFPVRNYYSELGSLDSDDLVCHEAGHHLHRIINPSLVRQLEPLIKIKEAPHEFSELKELVAEYPVMILGLVDYDKPPYSYYWTNLKRVYAKYGAEFLPDLARMSLDDAIRQGLVQ